MASKAKILKSIQHFDNVGKEIERFEERIRDAIAEPDCSAALIDVLKSKIEKYEKKLEETFSELNIDVGEEKWEKYLDMQDSLLNCSVWLEKVTHTFKKETGKENLENKNLVAKMPKLELPQFHGEMEYWITFKELFQATVIDNSDLTERQIAIFICVSKGIRTNKANSAKQLFEILDNCNESVRNLTVLGLEINQLSELIIINHCTSKLHEEIAHRWELTLKPDTYPTLQAFRMFIESEARALGLLSGNADAPKSKLGTNLLEGLPIFGPAGTPTAIPTKLGYILSGKIYAPPLKESIVNSSLNDQLSELWKLEEVPKTNDKNQIPDPCEESFSKSVKRNNEALGHMREISQKRDDETPNCYIPYHMVTNEKSTTTKCLSRVVFNASSKIKNGKSLNDVLMTGPKLQTEIFNHLIKFRSYRVAFTADIEKMYRQILISDEDCKYQRIVWRATPSDSLKSFELQTITYGTSRAPFLALRTLLQLYQDEEQNFPLAAKIARENIYIDDLLSGADTEVEAKSIIIEIQNLLKSGGFILRKWCSHPKVLQDLDTSLLASKPIHSLGDEESKQRVLGLIWNLKTDSIQVKVVHEEIVKTKRQLLSVIAQIFDPLGLFSPSVITLKIMLQELWKSKAFWDDPIPSSILENWNQFTKESKYLNSISIPRFMGIDQNSDIILHGFCDASTKAYAAVVYLKSKQEIHLVSAKTRVAPIKQLTIPRLELCGALLLAELISVIQKALRTKPAECFLWTDSTIVLSWLMKPLIKENIFVKNDLTLNHRTLKWEIYRNKESPKLAHLKSSA
ncbi:integrase catalytic domain-containing protein [Trichonephila clavipes]|nr:integrase catalytic domain-containing protein [Trichonephila clavipes]